MFGFALALWTLFSCRNAPVDTSDASDESSDTEDSEPEVGPCGEGRPAGCVQVLDGVCLFADIPDRLRSPNLPQSSLEQVTPSEPEPCGLQATLRCEVAVALVSVTEDGVAGSGGWPEPHENAAWWVQLWDLETFAQLGVAELYGPPADEGCPLSYYGDPSAFPCVQHAFAFVRERYAGCGRTQACERCQCRYNDFAPLAECASPAE